MICSAVIEGPYRYSLTRRWGEGPCLAFVMLNPSTADASTDDATIRRCLRFARDMGYDALTVVNLYAWRATNPRDLWTSEQPIGPGNDVFITQAASEAQATCLAWGALTLQRARMRAAHVVDGLLAQDVRPQALRITRSGYPQHPLYLPATCRLVPFPADGVPAASSHANTERQS